MTIRQEIRYRSLLQMHPHVPVELYQQPWYDKPEPIIPLVSVLIDCRNTEFREFQVHFTESSKFRACARHAGARGTDTSREDAQLSVVSLFARCEPSLKWILSVLGRVPGLKRLDIILLDNQNRQVFFAALRIMNKFLHMYIVSLGTVHTI